MRRSFRKKNKTPCPLPTQRTWAVTIQRRTEGVADVNADYLFWVIMIQLVDPCGTLVLSKCSCATTGPLCLPSRCFQFDARPSIFSRCLPKVTYSSAIMRYTLHREDSLFFSPPYTHAHTPHGESLLSPFLQALYTRHKLLNPQNTVL